MAPYKRVLGGTNGQPNLQVITHFQHGNSLVTSYFVQSPILPKEKRQSLLRAFAIHS
jgi:hypothetical protein